MDMFQELYRVGPVLEEKLHAAGYKTFADIAASSTDEVSTRTGMRPGTAAAIVKSAIELTRAAGPLPKETVDTSGMGNDRQSAYSDVDLRELATELLRDSKAVTDFAVALGAELTDRLGSKLARRVGKRVLSKKKLGRKFVRALAQELISA